MSGGKENLNQSCNSKYSKTASSPPAHSGAQKRSLLVRRRRTRNWPWGLHRAHPLLTFPMGPGVGGAHQWEDSLPTQIHVREEQIVLSLTQPITAHLEWRGVASVAPRHLTLHKTLINSNICIFNHSTLIDQC